MLHNEITTEDYEQAWHLDKALVPFAGFSKQLEP